MTEDIGGKLAALRRQAGLSQKELAQRLTDLGEPLSDKALSKWEKGATLPSARQFLTACRALGVEDISGEFLGRGLAHGLDGAGRRKLAEYADLLRRSGLYEPKPERGRAIRLYTLAASAGPDSFWTTGIFGGSTPRTPRRTRISPCGWRGTAWSPDTGTARPYMCARRPRWRTGRQDCSSGRAAATSRSCGIGRRACVCTA